MACNMPSNVHNNSLSGNTGKPGICSEIYIYKPDQKESRVVPESILEPLHPTMRFDCNLNIGSQTYNDCFPNKGGNIRVGKPRNEKNRSLFQTLQLAKFHRLAKQGLDGIRPHIAPVFGVLLCLEQLPLNLDHVAYIHMNMYIYILGIYIYMYLHKMYIHSKRSVCTKSHKSFRVQR